MTTSMMTTPKSTGLTKTGEPIRQLAMRLERARQARNEKVVRADTEYFESVRRAVEAVSQMEQTQAAETSESELTPAL